MTWLFIQATKACINLNPNSVNFLDIWKRRQWAGTISRRYLRWQGEEAVPSSLGIRVIMKMHSVEVSSERLQRVCCRKTTLAESLLHWICLRSAKNKKTIKNVTQGTDASIPSGVSETVFIWHQIKIRSKACILPGTPWLCLSQVVNMSSLATV